MPLHKERLNVSSRRKRGAKKSNRIEKRILSALFASLLVVVFTPVKLEAMPLTTENANKSTTYTLSLNEIVVENNSKAFVMTPGESKVDQEARVAAEAAAAAKAKAKVVRDTVSRERRVYSDPSNFDAVYGRAGQAFGVDPRLLKAIHTVETGASGSTSRSNPSGATGPMQFLPSTFRHHQVDGNGDGIYDITNLEDSVFAAAQYLVACGYPDIHKALWGYNPSSSYYRKVMGIAHNLGM